MDAAQALRDLTEVSSQIEGAVMADAAGGVLASTFPDGIGERVAAEAIALLAAADASAAAGSRAPLAQLVASLGGGAVFVVRSGERLVAAVTGPEPTAGLVLYDLKTCLRLAEEPPRPALRRRPRSQSGAARAESAASGRRNTRKKKDGDA